LRDLTRYRVRLTQEKAREVNRVQKTLEDTNLKLGDVVSDIMGKASRMILHAIAQGETDPARLAAMAVGRVRATQEQLEAALNGTVTDHHRFLLVSAFDPDSSSGASYRASHRRNYAAFYSTTSSRRRNIFSEPTRNDPRNGT